MSGISIHDPVSVAVRKSFDFLKQRLPVIRQSSPLNPNAKLGRYEIVRQISKGGFSWVYKALAPDAKPVFIKEFSPHSCGFRSESGFEVFPGKERECKEARRRFIDEARLLASFRYPGFPRIRELNWSGNQPYIVFEWERGKTLAQHLAIPRSPIPESTILFYFGGILKLLEKMHKEQILHLDLHPGNLFFRLDQKPVILDLGCARHVGDLSLFSGPLRMYTHGYTPPEIVQKGGLVGPWSDFYMLGCCLRDCGTMDGHCSEPLFSLTQTLLKRNPMDRPQSLDDPLLRQFMPI